MSTLILKKRALYCKIHVGQCVRVIDIHTMVVGTIFGICGTLPAVYKKRVSLIICFTLHPQGTIANMSHTS